MSRLAKTRPVDEASGGRHLPWSSRPWCRCRYLRNRHLPLLVYWVGGDSGHYSSRGPGFRVPPDGGVEGGGSSCPRRTVPRPPRRPPRAPTSNCAAASPARRPNAWSSSSTPARPGIAPVGRHRRNAPTTCDRPGHGQRLASPATRGPIALPQRWPDLWLGGFPATPECPGQTASRPASSAPATTAPDIPDPVTVPAPAGSPCRRHGRQRPHPPPTPLGNRTPTSTDTPRPGRPRTAGIGRNPPLLPHRHRGWPPSV